MRKITYSIQRFDGTKTFTQDFVFPHQPGKTILWGLTTIKETIDPSLTFVAACRSAVCGACAVRVNGQAILACETALDDVLKRYGTDTIHLAPLANFTVLRDLAVDWEPKARRLAEVRPWILPKTEFSVESGCRQSAAEFNEIRTQASCILCGACASECNKLSINDEDFYDPFIYTKAYKFVADSRDSGEMEHLKPVMENGAWKCVHCQECVTKCPKKVAPADDIAALRNVAVKRGLNNNPGARHALAFYSDLGNTGRLNEIKLSLKTEGLLKTFSRLPFALRLLRRGKLDPFHLFPSPVKGIEQVRAILKAVKEAEKK